jgi:hypothetical protein
MMHWDGMTTMTLLEGPVFCLTFGIASMEWSLHLKGALGGAGICYIDT